MYKIRTAGYSKSNLQMRWALPERIFFACGACHILAYAFLEQYGSPDMKALWLRPEPGFTGNHIFISTDTWYSTITAIPNGSNFSPIRLSVPGTCGRAGKQPLSSCPPMCWYRKPDREPTTGYGLESQNNFSTTLCLVHGLIWVAFHLLPCMTPVRRAATCWTFGPLWGA
jgi:hypothetical protein